MTTRLSVTGAIAVISVCCALVAAGGGGAAAADQTTQPPAAPPTAAQPPAAQPPAQPPAKKPASRFDLSADDEEDTPKPVSNVPKGLFAGTAECVRCHAKQAQPYVDGPHGREWDERTPASKIGCETCHGPGQAHDDKPSAKGLVRAFTKMAPREASDVCLKCHDRQKHVAWQGSMHDARNITCVSCHSIHQPKSERLHLKAVSVEATCAQCHRDKLAKLQRASAHMPVREGKMSCASCHDPHGSTNSKLLRVGNTVNESCISCHAEKRGPFLWDHPPVSENCTTCHDPHGSSNNRMLVSKETMLCQRCHISTRHPATPYDGVALASLSNRLVNRGCVNCHQTIHGSNHPSGQFYQR